MNLFKRIVCLVLVAILCAGLVACAGNGKTASNSDISSSQTDTSSEVDSEEPEGEEPEDEDSEGEEPEDEDSEGEEPEDEDSEGEEPEDEDSEGEEPEDEDSEGEEPEDEDSEGEEPEDEESEEEEPEEEEPEEEYPEEEEPEEEESEDEDSEGEEPEEESEEEPEEESSEDASSHRAPYVAPEKPKPMVDNDHLFENKKVSWNGPEGYVIVIPASNVQAKKTAAALQDYYKTIGVALNIVTDNTAKTAKEILIGKTNRAESNKKLAEADLEVSIKNGKLVFDGGHDVTVDMAVGKFMQLKPQKKQAFTFKLTTDFSTKTFLPGYEYVWGDEFEGRDVDFTKWAFNAKMSAYVDAAISYDREITNVEDGRLKLRGIRCFDPDNEGIRFKMPVSVVTQFNMMFTFGYAEIRARMPFFKGAWPSFWTQSATGVGERKCLDYMVEIDVFEVFGSPEGEVISTIHKWYDRNHYNYGELHDKYDTEGNPITHTGWTKERKWWTAPNPDTINYEYHTYGWEWTPEVMKMYVDGEFITEYDIVTSTDGAHMKGFHDPEYIIFNNHITSRAAADAGQYTVGAIDDNLELLPANYFIDYFRLYQKPGVGKIWIDETPRSTYPDRK